MTGTLSIQKLQKKVPCELSTAAKWSALVMHTAKSNFI
jgi:hypothetical protein